MVHEYTHYLQDPKWMTRYYNMGYTYKTHPYEIQAFLMEGFKLVQDMQIEMMNANG